VRSGDNDYLNESHSRSWRRGWQAARWPLLIALDLALLLLRYIGFHRYALAVDLQLSPTDLLYRTLQLVTLESGALVGPLNWELEVARLLLPALTATTAIAAAAVLFKSQLQRLRLRFLRGHVVICALGARGTLGAKGTLLATSFRAAGHDVVALERHSQGDNSRTCRAHGVLVLEGDATDHARLVQARVLHARLVFAVTGDDATNVALALAASALPRQSRLPLSIFAHLVDSWLCEWMRDQALDVHGARIDLFNIHDRAARIRPARGWQQAGQPAWPPVQTAGPWRFATVATSLSWMQRLGSSAYASRTWGPV
jgi:hypothetical protein